MLNVAKKIVDENYSILANEVYNDKGSSNEEVLVYCILQKFYNIAKNNGVCSINIMKDLMYIDNRNENIFKSLRVGIDNCIKKEMIYNLEDLRGNKIEFKDIKNDTTFTYSLDLPEKYFKIYEYMYNDIFKYLHDTVSNINKFAIFRYFTSVSRVINSESEFGYLSQTNVKFCGESRAITRYNSTLNDLEIFQYNNSYYTEERHYNATFFGWFGDDDNFNFHLNNEVSSRNLIKVDKGNIKVKVSNTQKINKTKTKIETSDADEEITVLKAKLEQLELEKKKLANMEYVPQEYEMSIPKGKGLLSKIKNKVLPVEVIEETMTNPKDKIVYININKGLSDEIRLKKVHNFIIASVSDDKELQGLFTERFHGRTNGLIGAEVEKFEKEVHKFIDDYNEIELDF